MTRQSFANPLDGYYAKRTGTLPATGAGFPAQHDAAMATGKSRILAAGAAPTPGAREAAMATRGAPAALSLPPPDYARASAPAPYALPDPAARPDLQQAATPGVVWDPTGYGAGPPSPSGPGRAPAASPFDEGVAAVRNWWDTGSLDGAPGKVGQAAKDWYDNGGPLGGYTRNAIEGAKDWYTNGGPLGQYTTNWWNTGSIYGKQPSATSTAEAATPDRTPGPPADGAPDLPALSDRNAGRGDPTRPPHSGGLVQFPVWQNAYGRDTTGGGMPAGGGMAAAAATGSSQGPVPESRPGSAQATQGAQFTHTIDPPVAKPARRAKPAASGDALQPGAPMPPLTAPTQNLDAPPAPSAWDRLTSASATPTPAAQAKPAPTFGQSGNLFSWLAGARDPDPVQARPDAPQPWRMMNER